MNDDIDGRFRDFSTIDPKSSEGDLDASLVSALTRDGFFPGFADSVTSMNSLMKRARYHGVSQLIIARLDNADLPDEIRMGFQRERVSQIFWEERHQQLLSNILADLASQNIQPVILKGTALAYSYYSEPWLRTRGDTDILVAEQDFSRASTILEEHGLRRSVAISGDFISYQESFYSDGDIAHDHCIDLHRKINNSEFISKLFSYLEIREQSQPLPLLSPDARAASPKHALQHACIHRGIHEKVPYYVDGVARYGGDRLIWYYDIHLLASSFTQNDWSEFVEDCRSKGVCETCRDALTTSRKLFSTRVEDDVLENLDRGGDAVADYLKAGLIRRTWINFGSLPGPKARLQYARELLFPPVSYMRDKYGSTHVAWLPWLYLRRFSEGVIRRLKGTR
jgi:hypothetical protein